MNRYEIILYWSDEDEVFIAKVAELAVCVADGPTRHAALANAEKVISEWRRPHENLVDLSRNLKAVCFMHDAPSSLEAFEPRCNFSPLSVACFGVRTVQFLPGSRTSSTNVSPCSDCEQTAVSRCE